jgi:hypothetical protein
VRSRLRRGTGTAGIEAFSATGTETTGLTTTDIETAEAEAPEIEAPEIEAAEGLLADTPGPGHGVVARRQNEVLEH